MTSDTPEPQDPSPQDPARFSRVKSEPPILDLEVEKPPSSSHTPPSDSAPSEHDRLDTGKKPLRSWQVGGLLGGLVGGSIVALGVLGYTFVTDPTAAKFILLENSLSEKADSSNVIALDKRIAHLEATLAEINSSVTSAANKTTVPDANMVRRIDAIDAAIQALVANAAQPVASTDKRALRLALIVSLRDAIRNDLTTTREIAALEKSGESSQEFVTLKLNLSSPLISFDEIRAEIVALTKDAPAESVSPTEQIPSSRLTAFLSQFVTVRPVTSIAKPPSADLSFSSLLDAVDQDDAKAALASIAAMPQAMHEKFKSIEAELKRRIVVETAISQFHDDALNDITKGDAP